MNEQYRSEWPFASMDRMSDSTLSKLRNASVYVHVFCDGSLLFQRDKEKNLSSISVDELEAELTFVAGSGGILYYSIEELEVTDTERFEKTTHVLFNTLAESQMVHPRPEVYDYEKSFTPYLCDALEVAALDVQGLLEQVAEERENMKQLQRGSLLFLEAQVRLRKTEERYIRANLYLEQISLLHSELCLDYEDLEG